MVGSFVEKAAAAGSALVAVSLASGVEAVVLYQTGSSPSISMDSAQILSAWDVDGIAGPEFILKRSTNSLNTPIKQNFPVLTSYGYINYYYTVAIKKTITQRINLKSVDSVGAGMVGPIFHDQRLQALRNSVHVGPTLASYYWNLSTSPNGRQIISRVTIEYKPIPGAERWVKPQYTSVFSSFGEEDFPAANGFSRVGENIIGFRFGNGAGTEFNYGWAKIEWDLTTLGSEVFTISEWAWENEAGISIHATTDDVARIPAPVPALSGLALLVIGAAGVRRHRRKASQISE